MQHLHTLNRNIHAIVPILPVEYQTREDRRLTAFVEDIEVRYMCFLLEVLEDAYFLWP